MVSSANKIKHEEFVKRFTEVCETRQPSEIAKYLDVSYQAAKNYLTDRLPDTKTLLVIAEKTPYSIHWLLTGEGEKLVNHPEEGELTLFLNSLKQTDSSAFLSSFALFIDEYLTKNKQNSTDSPVTVILKSDKIRHEKVKRKDSKDLPTNPS